MVAPDARGLRVYDGGSMSILSPLSSVGSRRGTFMNASLLVGLAAPVREVVTAGWTWSIPVLLVLGCVWVFASIVRRDAVKTKHRTARMRNQHHRR